MNSVEQNRWRKQYLQLRNIRISNMCRYFVGLAVLLDGSRRFMPNPRIITLYDIPRGHWRGRSREVWMAQTFRIRRHEGTFSVNGWAERRCDFRCFPYDVSCDWMASSADGTLKSLRAGKLTKDSDSEYLYLSVDGKPMYRIANSECAVLQYDIPTVGKEVGIGDVVCRCTRRLQYDTAMRLKEANGVVLNTRREATLLRALLDLNDSLTKAAYSFQGGDWQAKREAFFRSINQVDHVEVDCEERHLRPYLAMDFASVSSKLLSTQPTNEYRRMFANYMVDGCPVYSEQAGRYLSSAEIGNGLKQLSFEVEKDGQKVVVHQTVPADVIITADVGETVSDRRVLGYGPKAGAASYADAEKLLGAHTNWFKVHALRGHAVFPGDEWQGRDALLPAELCWPYANNDTRTIWDVSECQKYVTESGAAILPPLATSGELDSNKTADEQAAAHFRTIDDFTFSGIRMSVLPRDKKFSRKRLAMSAGTA